MYTLYPKASRIVEKIFRRYFLRPRTITTLISSFSPPYTLSDIYILFYIENESPINSRLNKYYKHWTITDFTNDAYTKFQSTNLIIIHTIVIYRFQEFFNFVFSFNITKLLLIITLKRQRHVTYRPRKHGWPIATVFINKKSASIVFVDRISTRLSFLISTWTKTFITNYWTSFHYENTNCLYIDKIYKKWYYKNKEKKNFWIDKCQHVKSRYLVIFYSISDEF